MLVIFGGLPGTGKTTIAQRLAARRAATYLRIDTIEQVIRSSAAVVGPIGPLGYGVAQALAVSNLKIGLSVVADSVNPVPESRAAWRAVAAQVHRPFLEVELICSDRAEHRRRIEGRQPDIDGLIQPSWHDVLERLYAPWPKPHLVIDTAVTEASDAVDLVERHMIGSPAERP